MAQSAFPNKPGVYTLIIGLSQECNIEIGQLGIKNFGKGFYTYTGSAQGSGGGPSLGRRIGRHLSSDKKKHWHIDYLLSSEYARLAAVAYSKINSRIECTIASTIGDLERVAIPIRGFGSSDCNGGCGSHLHYFPRTTSRSLVRRICRVYDELDLLTQVLVL